MQCSGYGTKQSYGKATVILELWWIQSTLLLPSLQGLLWAGVVAPDRILSIGQTEVFDILTVLMLNWIVWNTTVLTFKLLVCSARAAKYITCISPERYYSSNVCPGYGTKQFDGEASVMLDRWGMQSTSLLSSHPGLLWLGEVASDRVLSMG